MHIESILLFRIYHVIIFFGVEKDIKRIRDEKAHGLGGVRNSKYSI